MGLNYSHMIRALGVLLILIGMAMIPSMLLAHLYGERSAFFAFSATGFSSILAGLFLFRFFNPKQARLKIRDGFLIVSSCWLLASLMGSVPYLLSGGIGNPVDAFFESVSGFTTTGASILVDASDLPRSLLFWRSFTQWLGGMGILLFAAAILPSLGTGGAVIIQAEVSGPSLEKIAPKMSDNAKILFILYACFTLLEIVLLLLGDLDPYHATLLAFSTISTGGFSPYSISPFHLGSGYLDGVVICFMIIGGTSFHLYYTALRRGIGVFGKDAEFRLYVTLLVISSALLSLGLFAWKDSENAKFAIFQTVSIMTTTGFAATDYNLWPALGKMIIFALMFVGACSSSAGGGIKVIRILLLWKLIARGFSIRLHPNAVVPIRIREKVISSDSISRIISFFFLYLVIVVTASMLISLDQPSMAGGISAVVACLGNIGCGFGEVGSWSDYTCFSSPSKILLSLLMLIGRLELFTLLLLASPRFWNPNR